MSALRAVGTCHARVRMILLSFGPDFGIGSTLWPCAVPRLAWSHVSIRLQAQHAFASRMLSCFLHPGCSPQGGGPHLSRQDQTQRFHTCQRVTTDLTNSCPAYCHVTTVLQSGSGPHLQRRDQSQSRRYSLQRRQLALAHHYPDRGGGAHGNSRRSSWRRVRCVQPHMHTYRALW